MPITVNLRHLEDGKAVHLEGEISAKELELEELDEMIHAQSPLVYNLDVEQSGNNLLVSGALELDLNCECVRCLKPFQHPIRLEPYDLLVPLEGEDKAVVSNDLVDLTEYVREDILLAFPPHPVCAEDCKSLPPSFEESKPSGDSGAPMRDQKSAWDELNKLKLK